MPYLFDTDAISEVFKPRPNPHYLAWLRTVPRREQFTTTIVVGELFAGAFLSTTPDRHLHNIRERLLPELTVLPFDLGAAEAYGRVRSSLQRRGQMVTDTDLQIAATALANGMTLVTGNLKHYRRIEGLDLCTVLDDGRRKTQKR